MNDVHWTELVRIPDNYTDMSASLLHDMLCAIRSLEHIDDDLYLDDFDHKYIGELEVPDFYEYDRGLAKWLSLSETSTIKDLKDFRGYQWMLKASKWMQTGVPPVIVIKYDNNCQVGDGRGRINIANMVGYRVPTYFMRYRDDQ